MYTPILFLVSSIATSIFNYSIWHTLLPIPKPERTAIGTTLTQTEIGSVLHLSVESIDSLYYPNESFWRKREWGLNGSPFEVWMIILRRPSWQFVWRTAWWWVRIRARPQVCSFQLIVYTIGVYVANRVADKIEQIDDRIFMCRSGSAADTQKIGRVIRAQLDQFRFQVGLTGHA